VNNHHKRGEKRVKILGIDPGSRNLGYAFIHKKEGRLFLEEAGLIRIKERELKYQISELCEGIDTILSSFSVDDIAVEDIFFAYNPKTVIKLAQFRGALMLKILQVHGDFYEYTPLQVKRALTGRAKAGKEQVALMVRSILGIKGEIKPFDITDAMAVAITHSQRIKGL
jgi:crossover junction endodeoxyribonuclease RuvC